MTRHVESVQAPPAQPQTHFLTVGEVAAVLRVSNMTVYRLINAGEIPAVRIGRSFRLREEDLDRYLADQLTRAG
jgi:excisionase family DNA binding protein